MKRRKEYTREKSTKKCQELQKESGVGGKKRKAFWKEGKLVQKTKRGYYERGGQTLTCRRSSGGVKKKGGPHERKKKSTRFQGALNTARQ